MQEGLPAEGPQLSVPVSTPVAAPVQEPAVRYEQQEIFRPAPAASVPESVEEPAASYETPKAGRPDVRDMRLVGQVFRTYWIAETVDTVYMIDQHAAHERVIYDRLKARLSEGSLDSQILLQPLIVTLPPDAYRHVMDKMNVFDRLGYGIQPFGENTVIIREVPYIFNGPLGQEDFQTLVDLLEDEGRRADTQLLIDRMAMTSCKAAVKGNDAISFEEMQSLLEQLLASSNPFNCPHGRPTMLTMTKQEVEHRFGRS